MAKVALVAGAGGAASKRLIEVLLADPDWSVLALARSPRASSPRLTAISVDLSDRDACARALANQRGITHIFYTSRAKHGETGIEDIGENVGMLQNVLDVVEPVAKGLEHIHIVQGLKYYGMHLGPFPTRVDENAPRASVGNFYYDQQDMLAERQRGATWAWSATRPTFLYDFAPERARNGIAVIGAYAALCRELGKPLDFPGPVKAFEAERDATDASLFARAMKFIATSPNGRNQAFNVNNGDFFSWQELWPKIAEYAGVASGRPRPFSLLQWTRDKEPVWSAIVRRHGLRATTLDEVADWAFADFHWSHPYDVSSSSDKLHKAGFNERLDSWQMTRNHLMRYREAKILP